MHRLLLNSPVGPLFVEYDADGVRALSFWRQGEHPPAGTRDAGARDDALGRQVERELGEYFAGARRAFSLPLAQAGTDFQRRVWAALARIPYGETRSYAALAAEIGAAPGAARAVGQANGRNALPILVPCHRVIAADGSLGGYLGADAGAGLEVKRWLVSHERGMMNGA
jgi:methylated-DNA-[protein]-cysteine S-methyltransferase